MKLTFEGSGAKIVCDMLSAVGTSTIFGVPGDTGVALYDALHNATDLQHVLMNDERGAVFAADAYARSSGRVGVAEVSSGGGATFCIGGLGEALAASIPLVIISSDIHRNSRGTGALTETDQAALFAAVTKAQHVVNDLDHLANAMNEAFIEAASGRPGPVAVIIPEDLLDERGTVTVDVSPIEVPLSRPSADAATVAEVASALLTAEKPVFLVGGGVHLSQAYDELAELATRVGAYVATSIHGKGVFDETHPLSVGVAGGNGARPYSTAALAGSDMALLIGTRANATDTDAFQAPPRSTKVVTVDINPAGPVQVNYPDAVHLTGDARVVLRQLLSAIAEIEEKPAPRAFEAPAARSEWARERDADVDAPQGLVHPWAVMAAVKELAPEGTTIVADCGTPTPYLAANWEFSRPGRSLVTPRGHGPMGYAMPGAVGASFARPDSPIVVFTTDGSMIMAAGALESAARAGRRITYVQFTNGSLGWIKALQHFYHESRYFGTQLSEYKPALVAEGFGIPAVRTDSLYDFEIAFKNALNGTGPAFIDVPTPDEQDIIPPVVSWRRASSGEDSVRPVY